jgi:hypothetical protein
MKIRDLKPGLAINERTGRYVRIEAIDVQDGVALVWMSSDGREAHPFPYDADAELGEDITSLVGDVA